jgi:hypothetical protein
MKKYENKKTKGIKEKKEERTAEKLSEKEIQEMEKRVDIMEQNDPFS